MKNSKKILTVIAIVVALSSIAFASYAYFTTYAFAKGGKEINLDYESSIDESVSGLEKQATIKNIGSAPIFIRVHTYLGDEYKDYEVISGKDWELGDDGYWYYKEVVLPGESTSVLYISLSDLPDDIDTDSINLIVMHESTPVIYVEAEDGNMKETADWNMILDVSNSNSKGGSSDEE